MGTFWLGGHPVPNANRGSTRDKLARQGLRKLELKMGSGDCMVFEGKTWHQVKACIPNSSPLDGWLQNRRLSIIVRQKDKGAAKPGKMAKQSNKKCKSKMVKSKMVKNKVT